VWEHAPPIHLRLLPLETAGEGRVHIQLLADLQGGSTQSRPRVPRGCRRCFRSPARGGGAAAGWSVERRRVVLRHELLCPCLVLSAVVVLAMVLVVRRRRSVRGGVNRSIT